MAVKKVNGNTYDISSINRVTKKFLDVSRCSRAKQRQRNVQEKCAARAKLLCCFSPFSGVSCRVACLRRFYILFEQTVNIIESFAFSPG